MVSNEQIEEQLLALDEVEHVKVSGDGYYYKLTIVSDAFLNKTKVARQQWVYSLLKEHITSGSLHALSMQTFTKAEWEKNLG